jgi:hypothetical protein
MAPPPWYEPTTLTVEPIDRLTFGVEIEIVIPCLYPEDEDPGPQDKRSPSGIMDYGPVDKSSNYRQYRSTYSNTRKHVAQTLSTADIQPKHRSLTGPLSLPGILEHGK